MPHTADLPRPSARSDQRHTTKTGRGRRPTAMPALRPKAIYSFALLRHHRAAKRRGRYHEPVRSL